MSGKERNAKEKGMFGYLNIDSSLQENQAGVFHTFTCGTCLATKKLFGNVARLWVGHDINVLNILFHSCLGVQPKPYKGRCVMSPVKERLLLETDEITDSLAVYNVLLFYYKLLDNYRDERSLVSKIAVSSFKGLKEKAKSMRGDFDETISRRLNELYGLEKRNCDVLDEVSEPFSALSRDLCIAIAKEKVSRDLSGLCYNVGKWIYLIDALDDLEKDIKKGSYNPIRASFGGEDAKKIVEDNYDELQFLFYNTLNYTAKCYNDLGLRLYDCVLRNVFHVSMRNKTEEIFGKYLNRDLR